MSDFRSLVRRYQTYDPATGRFDVRRSDRQYSLLLGVRRDLLSKFYAKHVESSHVILTAFMRTFPSAASEVASSIGAKEAAHAVALSAGTPAAVACAGD